MVYDVIVTHKKNKYVARVKEWPDVTAEEESREGVLLRIKLRLLEYLTKQVEIVQIDVPVPVKTENPWLEKFGWFHDDPTFEDLQQEIAAYRRELDQTMELQTL